MAWLWAASPCGCVLAELRRFGVDDLEKFDKRQGPEKESAPVRFRLMVDGMYSPDA
jgi:hypothetical protein